MQRQHGLPRQEAPALRGGGSPCQSSSAALLWCEGRLQSGLAYLPTAGIESAEAGVQGAQAEVDALPSERSSGLTISARLLRVLLESDSGRAWEAR